MARRPPTSPTEHQIQAAVFDWVRIARARVPELATYHAIPNGARLPWRKVTRGGRLVRICPEAQHLLAEGMTPGMLDTHWPLARGRYHGLWIEHKRRGEKMSDEQRIIAEHLAAAGACVVVSTDPETSIRTLTAYFALGAYHVDGPALSPNG